MSDSFRFLTEDMEDIREIFGNVSDREDVFSTGLAKLEFQYQILKINQM